MSDFASSAPPTHLPSRAPVVIIGAGQAGLSTAYWLLRRGLRPNVDMVIVDRDADAGGAWQHRWPAMRLGDAHRVHDLPGMHDLGLSFETAERHRPAYEIVVEYYRAYEAHFGLQVHHGHGVDHVVRPSPAEGFGTDRFEVVGTSATGGFSIRAQVVVSATGTWGAPFLPWYPGQNVFAGRQLHTHGYRSAEEFRGQRVGVVGGGTSAVEHLAELDGVAAQTHWFTRRPVRIVPTRGLTDQAGRASVAAADAAARAGRALPSIVSTTDVPITPYMSDLHERGGLRRQPMFRRLDEQGAVLADGTHVVLDAIIWDTGFRAELRHLAGLGLREEAGGIRVIDGVAQRDPALILAGYGPQASTITAERAGRLNARSTLDALDALGGILRS
ncbi:FAD-dependent oxidoreductase [Pseudoclavibacter sp. CFCC 13796]|uniref:FAD-dependent oxidoreductase n=1 Tax=Pseudoclavibacter sp. CFCC 13796 TaxID=2615179 RepID=UPI001CE3ECD5|nr:FAD-dependent oxidoreductase [Pseudoclavibacter sp. CFCC 13796]